MLGRMASLGARSAALRTAAPSVGLSLARRGLSTLFVRYLPREVELSELQSLLDEYQKANRTFINDCPVRLGLARNDQGSVTSSLGCAFVSCSGQMEAQDVLRDLKTAPAILPSGRPSLEPKLAKSGSDVYLAPSLEDPFVHQYKDVEASLDEMVRKHGPVTRVHFLRRNDWPMGVLYCDYENTADAVNAAKEIHNTNLPGHKYVLQARIYREGRNGRRGRSRNIPPQEAGQDEFTSMKHPDGEN